MILLLSCRANEGRWGRIRDGWLVPCGVPHVIVVGDPSLPRGGHAFEEGSRVLSVGCDDDYDELSYKVAFAVRAIHERFAPAFLFKIDDDVVVDPRLLARHASIPAAVEYGGKVYRSRCVTPYGQSKFRKPENRALTRVDAVFCGGPAYFLRARAIAALAAHMDPRASKYEDVAVGLALRAQGIAPVEVKLFTEAEAEFNRGEFVAWHDDRRTSFQNREPAPADVLAATVTSTSPGAPAPALAGTGSAGELDVRSAVAAVVPARGRASVAVGFAVRAPPGVRLGVRPVVALAEAGVDLCAADLDVRGVVVLHNHGDEPRAVAAGELVARLVFERAFDVALSF